jgi:hypothetical protein
MQKSLSDQDIYKLCNENVNIMSYIDMLKFNDIDNLLGKCGACVLLYDLEEINRGHWCCITRQDNWNIEFFDPYGIKPDRELAYSQVLDKKNTHLSKLLDYSHYKLHYNPYQFQEFKEGVNTCGRWCALRCIMKDDNIDKFYKKMLEIQEALKSSSLDDVAIELTENQSK